MLNNTIWGNPIETWLIALGVSVGLLLAVKLIRDFLVRRFFRLDQSREDDINALIAAMVKSVSMPIVALLFLNIGAQGLDIPAKLSIWVSALAMIAVIIQIARWGNVLISFGFKRYQKKHALENGERITTLRALSFVGRTVLFTIAALLALDNVPGVKITTLVASLGIGGIAVAMALQNVLGDIFASLSILLDKPFVIGDFIIVEAHMGTVEYIGLKTTRIRSLSGEQLVFSNSDLLKSRVRNYKRMAERRVVFSIGVVYQTDYDTLKKIPGLIRQIIEDQEHVRFDRSHFQGYGEFSLNFETVYYVLSPDYNRYMDIQQAINLAIFRQFETLNIGFAYPTRTVFLTGGPGQDDDGTTQSGSIQLAYPANT
ncbi:MAG: mechanosensitive ion channel family protein [Desulfosarcina sp.]|nr:mechanosensitive ion channel family protein [Desulfosarcina sp.]